MAITSEAGADGATVYRAYAVDEWYTFAGAAVVSERSAEEEVELQEALLRHGDRPASALVLQQQRRDSGAWAAEGGHADLASGALMAATAVEGLGGEAAFGRGGGRRAA